MRSKRGGGLHVLVGELKVGDRSGMPTAEKRLNLVRHGPCVMIIVAAIVLCWNVFVNLWFQSPQELMQAV